MKREDCYDVFIDRIVYDVIVNRFGSESASKLNAKIIDEIRVEAFELMSNAVKELGAVKGIFEEAVICVYKLKKLS